MGHRREAELQALYGGEDPLTLISSRSGRKRDKRTALSDRMSGMLAGRPETINEAGMPTDAPVLGSYQKGTLPWTPPNPTQALKAGEAVVDVPLEELFRSAQGDIQRPGRRSLGKLSDAVDYLESGKGINPAEASIRGGKAIIDDGFHRLRAAQQLGHKTAPVRVPLSQAGAFKKMLGIGKGMVGGVSALLDPLFGAIQDPELRGDLDPELQGTLDQILGTFGGEGRPQG